MSAFYTSSQTVATSKAQVGSGPLLQTSLDGTDGTLKVVDVPLGAAAASGPLCAANWFSGGAVAIQGMYAFDTATPAVDVINAGVLGSVVADWANTASPHSYLNAIKSIAPDLTIIMPRINDMNAGTSISAFSASLSAIVTEAKKYGDVHLVNAAAVNNGASGVATAAVSDTYTAAIKQVASSMSLPQITDLEASLGPWSSGSYYDNLHPLKAQHALMGQKVANDVLALIA